MSSVYKPRFDHKVNRHHNYIPSWATDISVTIQREFDRLNSENDDSIKIFPTGKVYTRTGPKQE